jgi:hypothetical protein
MRVVLTGALAGIEKSETRLELSLQRLVPRDRLANLFELLGIKLSKFSGRPLCGLRRVALLHQALKKTYRLDTHITTPISIPTITARTVRFTACGR